MGKRQSAPDGLQETIAELEAQRSETQRERDGRLGQVRQIETEKRSYIVAAKVQKNPGSQAELTRCDSELSALKSDIRDLDAAIGELTRQIDCCVLEFERAKWNAQCESLERLIEARADGQDEKRLLKLVTEAIEIGNRMNHAEDEIISSLHSLHPSLYSASRDIAYARERRRSLLSLLLDRGGLVEAVTNYGWTEALEKQGFVATAVAPYPAVLGAVEQIRREMLPGAESA